MPSARCQPRKMSLLACMSRWPATTRAPWLAYWLFLVKRSRTDASASLACRNRTSSWLAPCRRMIQTRVPTLPTPTTLRAIWLKRVLLQQVPAVGRQALAVPAQQLAEQSPRPARTPRSGKSSSSGTMSGGSLMMRRSPSTTCGQLVERPHGCPSSAPSPRALVAVAAMWACVFEPEVGAPGTPATRRAFDTSTWEYQTSRFDIVAIWRIDSRYVWPSATIASRRIALEWPLLRPATTTLAASRLTSHSHGPGMRLVEVVAVEDELALGRPEHAEVGEVRVPADLGRQTRARRGREVRRHDQGGAAEEGERGDQHPAVADRAPVRAPCVVACSSSSDTGSGRSGAGSKVAWLLAGHLGPGLLAVRPALLLALVRHERFGALRQPDPLSSAIVGHLPGHVAASSLPA